jgi:riboflavin synthase
MFTGIIEEIGKIVRLTRKSGKIDMHISALKSLFELKVNDSVSVNGVCQTVVLKTSDSFKVEAVEETLKKTTLGLLRVGASVNIELPMKLNERLGGHLVLGHVDCTGTIMKIDARASSWMYTVQFPQKFARYIIQIGSIAIDGVSLTIAELEENNFRVSIIPHTMENTIFKFYNVNDRVNLEFDIIGKYLEQIQKENNLHSNQNRIFSDRNLKESGY